MQKSRIAELLEDAADEDVQVLAAVFSKLAMWSLESGAQGRIAVLQELSALGTDELTRRALVASYEIDLLEDLFKK